MEAVISAGGKGTRLGRMAEQIPKALIPIAGKPLLRYQIEELILAGARKIRILTGNLSEKIESYLEENRFALPVEVVREESPLGTGGGLAALKGAMGDDFIFLYGDLMLSMDFSKMLRFHQEKSAFITLLSHPNSHPSDSDVLEVDSSEAVCAIIPKNDARTSYHWNLAIAGVYVLSPSVLDGLEAGKRTDFEKEIVASAIPTGRVFSYRTSEYVKDMGTPDRLKQVENDLSSGSVEARRLSNRQRAIFLDRDGTLNKYVGLLTKPSQLELLSGAAEAVKRVNKSGYLCFMISNQPVVARNLCSIDDVKTIHKKLETELGAHGAYLDDSRFCPHHPDKGYPEENKAFKIDCACRKPKIGMIAELASKYNVDLASSWMIGDTSVDVQTAVNAGMRSVLVRTGEAGGDGKYAVSPDRTCDDLASAVASIMEKK